MARRAGEGRREAVLNMIRVTNARGEPAPSLRDIAGALGCSVSTAQRYLVELADRGQITRWPGKSRAVRLPGTSRRCPTCGAELAEPEL